MTLGDDIVKGNLGGKGFLLSSEAILLQLPNNTYDEFMYELDATLDKDSGKYFEDCDDANDLPELTVTAGDLGVVGGAAKFRFTANDYVDMVRQRVHK